MAAVLLGAANAALVALAARRAGTCRRRDGGRVLRRLAAGRGHRDRDPSGALRDARAPRGAGRARDHPGPARRRALVLAGCGLGFALTVKIWAVVPVAVVLVWFVVRFGRRAAALGRLDRSSSRPGCVCLPFLLAAPSSMFRMVVLDQVSRGRMASTLAERTPAMLGLSSVVGHRPHLQGPLLLLLAAGVALLVLTWVRVPSARVAVMLLVAQGGVVLASPSYFRYYDAYPAPALALCVGAAATAVLGLLARSGPPVVRRVAAVTVACGLLLALGAVAGSDEDAVVGRPFPERGCARSSATPGASPRTRWARSSARRLRAGPASRLPGRGGRRWAVPRPGRGRARRRAAVTETDRPALAARRQRLPPVRRGAGAGPSALRRVRPGPRSVACTGPWMRLDGGVFAVYGR